MLSRETPAELRLRCAPGGVGNVRFAWVCAATCHSVTCAGFFQAACSEACRGVRAVPAPWHRVGGQHCCRTLPPGGCRLLVYPDRFPRASAMCACSLRARCAVWLAACAWCETRRLHPSLRPPVARHLVCLWIRYGSAARCRPLVGVRRSWCGRCWCTPCCTAACLYIRRIHLS